MKDRPVGPLSKIPGSAPDKSWCRVERSGIWASTLSGSWAATVCC